MKMLKLAAVAGMTMLLACMAVAVYGLCRLGPGGWRCAGASYSG